MRFIDRSLQPVVERYLCADERLYLTYGTRHARVVHRDTQDFVPVSGSSGDRRTRNNLDASLRRLSQTGCGLIAQKTHRVPRFAIDVAEANHV